MPKHPEINVELAGQDGNAFSILGRVTKAMRSAGLSDEEIAQFHNEATSGDYDNLLVTVVEWVNTDNEDEDYDEYYEWDEEEQEDVKE